MPMPYYLHPSPMLDCYYSPPLDEHNCLDFVSGAGGGGGGGGGGLGDYYSIGGPVIETLHTSTNGISRGIVHRHETESYGSSYLSERLSNLRLDDGHGGGGGVAAAEENRSSPDAGQRAVASSARTGNQPVVQPPLPPIVADNITPTQDVDLQDDSQEHSLSHDSQTPPHRSAARKSDDGLFAIPRMPQKPQNLWGEGEETAARTGPRRRHSVDNGPDGETLDANENSGLPLLRHIKSWKENTTRTTTQLLACPCLKEHLYRVHKQQPHCIRCGELFPDTSDVKVHLSRPDEVCDVARGVSIEGLTTEQIQKLKSKKRKPGVTTNEEKWQDIFAIVFPDARCCPDPYYSYFDDRSNNQNPLSMDHSDVESIFSDIPSESEERMFTKLEPICGHLEKRKRRKVLETFERFFAERVQQITERKALPRNDGDAMCPDVSSSDVLKNQSAAPDLEADVIGHQLSIPQNSPKFQDPPVLQTTSTTDIVGSRQEGALQGPVEPSLFNLPNGRILDNTQPEHEDIIVTGDEVPPNGCTSIIGPSSTPSIVFPNKTCDFVPLYDSSHSLKADELFVDFDFNDLLKDWVGHGPSGTAGGATDYFHT
ncbi:hypothetical protein CGCF245_v005898 [Colletotrichum fructicola]|nr:hypothetical protein CGCF245_v005898 [Colletotrichum fructicola]